ncbi:MAG: hypothetical protein JO171_09940 [Paludibacterium sp.]|uniref:hypothetical protein n=1 Tax=Paludibacterium sp. TaxID=1917523 RepID=UPI0025E653BF|nr:hypothetical protein [Paludibacterium sp.]MBV8047465.1 hypothetical protein [Paludibacterium sp.]MBV8646737.1 hypothetical protein [Paludibacterium sp.]
MNNPLRACSPGILTLPLLILAHHLAMLPHEYAHSLMAWLLGFKTAPLALHYGDASWHSLLTLGQMDENVDYYAIYLLGHQSLIAPIALAGPALANGGLFLGCVALINRCSPSKRWRAYFLYLYLLMNLGNLIDYIPSRVFSTHGDMGNVAFALGLSPWWILLLGGGWVAWAGYYSFHVILPRMYVLLPLTSTRARAKLLILSLVVLLGFFGCAGISGYGAASRELSVACLATIPGWIWMCWPGRVWVKRQIQQQRDRLSQNNPLSKNKHTG